MDEQELLFGKIACSLGVVTKEQVQECLLLQGEGETRPPIGQILIEKGYLTERQLEDVLATQRDYLRKVESHSREKVEDTIFGRLVITNRFATAEQVEEALLEQKAHEEAGRIVPLGSILVERGILTMDQVEGILMKQWKRILVCNTCRKQFNVFGYQESKRFLCRVCHQPLEIPTRLTSVRVEREK